MIRESNDHEQGRKNLQFLLISRDHGLKSRMDGTFHCAFHRERLITNQLSALRASVHTKGCRA